MTDIARCSACGSRTTRIRRSDVTGSLYCPSCFASVREMEQAGYERCADCNSPRQPDRLVTVVDFATGRHRDVCNPAIVCPARQADPCATA